MKTLDRKSMFGIFAAVAAVMVGAMPQVRVVHHALLELGAQQPRRHAGG